MVVKVKLNGLKIARNKAGKYYVYIRGTRDAILRNFEGDREALLRRLAEPDMIGAYNARRHRGPKSYPERTLGWLVAWFTDPEQCPEFKALAEGTQETYKKRLAYLEPGYDALLEIITQASLYEIRDRCAKEKWPTFADKMLTALSSMFTAAVKRGKMPSNPAQGIERIHKSDPNANREWRPEEWDAIISRAPIHLKIPMMLARYVGYRVQSIARVQWSNYQDDPVYGKCFRMDHRKNKEDQHWLPAAPELQAFLDGLERTSTYIAVKHDGTPWRDQEQMRKQISNFISGLKKKGIIAPGKITPHGLRVTFAAARRRETGASDEEVAAALGDRDSRMGAHYTRHVENEVRVIRAFGKPKRPKKEK
jgi:integrase